MEKHYESDEIEIDLKELFFEVIAEWKMIVVSTVLVGLIMFLISNFIITPQYQSTSKLYVFTKSTSITSLTDLQMGTNLTNDYMVVLGGRPVLDQVIENLGLDMTYAELAGLLSYSNPSNSRILEITTTHPDPNVAKAISDEVANVAAQFISDKMDQDPPSVIQYGYVATNPVASKRKNGVQNFKRRNTLGICGIPVFQKSIFRNLAKALEISRIRSALPSDVR